VYTKENDQEIYQILLDEFGEAASDTIVYTYIFRLCEPARRRALDNRLILS